MSEIDKFIPILADMVEFFERIARIQTFKFVLLVFRKKTAYKRQ